MKKYTYTFDLCANIDSDHSEFEKIPQEELKSAVMKRLENITKEERAEPFGVVDVISNYDEEAEEKKEEVVYKFPFTKEGKFLFTGSGLLAIEVISKFLISNNIKIPDDLRFISKAEWKTLDMPYCNNAELVVLGYHGKTREVFSLDGLNYKLNDRFQEMLQRHNLWFEEGCSTYGGVYTSPSDKI